MTTIALVDDDENILTSVSMFLESEGYHVQTYHDGVTALAGLTDYERWIEQRSEWPLSLSTGLRFAFYILIPLLPIIGSYAFERVADGLFRGAG